MNILLFLQPKADTVYISSDSTIRQCLEKMKAHGHSTIPVINEDGSFFGAISNGDLLWHIMDINSFELREQEQVYIKDIINRFWYQTIRIDSDIDELEKVLLEQNFAPVVDANNIYVGIITRRDLIDYLYKNSKDYNFSKYLYK